MSLPQHDSLFGVQVDEYRLEDLLGHGGMARVYRALDVRLNRYVAIKVIDTPFRSDAAYLMRFEHEAQAIGRLEHPNVVRLYRYGDVIMNEGQADAEPVHLLYMAMQYVQGATLAGVLESYRRDGELIPAEDALRITGEMCQALDYVHGLGIIHRDVKPSNILLSRDETSSSYHALLTDFGLALLTQMGTRGETFGTPHYIAPEQALSSAKAVPQSDLYSLGVILYEMFTGQLPFTAHDPMEIALQHMNQPPPPPRGFRPDLAPEVEAVILKALAKQPEQRYPSGAALYTALRQALHARPDALGSRISVPERVTLSTINILPALPREQAVSAQPENAAEAPGLEEMAAVLPAAEMPAADLPAADVPAAEKTPVVAETPAGGSGSSNATIQLPGAGERRDWEPGTAVASSTPEAPPSIPAVPSLQERPRVSHRRLWIGLGALAAAALFFGCLAAGVLAIRGLVSRLPGSSSAPPGAPVLETATPASGDAANPGAANPGAATPNATTSGPHTYTFQLSRCTNQGCLVLKNTGDFPIPLNSLILSAGNRTLKGSEWGISLLLPGDCVKAVKDESAYNTLPDGVTCNNIAGHPLMREGPDRIWDNTLSANLLGIPAGTCPKNAGKCTLNVTK